MATSTVRARTTRAQQERSQRAIRLAEQRRKLERQHPEYKRAVRMLNSFRLLRGGDLDPELADSVLYTLTGCRYGHKECEHTYCTPITDPRETEAIQFVLGFVVGADEYDAEADDLKRDRKLYLSK